MSQTPPVFTDQQAGYSPNTPPVFSDDQANHPAQASFVKPKSTWQKIKDAYDTYSKISNAVYSYPAQAALNVLGTGNRAVMGAIGAHKADVPQYGFLPVAGRMFYAAFHPSQTQQFTEEAERGVGLRHYTAEDMPATTTVGPERMQRTLTQAQREEAAKALNFGEDFLFQTATDPLTYLGGIGPARAAGSKLLGLIPRVLSKTPGGEQLVHFAQVAPELANATPIERATVLQAENIGKNYSDAIHDDNLAWANKNKKALQDRDQSVLPEYLRRTYRWLYLEGTEGARKWALSKGYQPTAYERTLPPGNVVGIPREDYIHTFGSRPKSTTLQSPGVQTVRRAQAGYAKPQTQPPSPELDLYKSFVARSESARRQLGSSPSNMLGKAIALEGLGPETPGLAPLGPDIKGTQIALRAARNRGDVAKVQELTQRLKEEKKTLTALRANPMNTSKMIPLSKLLENNKSAYASESILRPSAFYSAAEDLGLHDRGWTYASTPLDTKDLAKQLSDMNIRYEVLQHLDPTGMEATALGEKRAAIMQQLTERETANRDLNALMTETQRRIDRTLNRPVPGAAGRHLFAPSQAYTGLSWLRTWADYRRLSLFANFIKHGLINIPVFAAHGPQGITGAVIGMIRGALPEFHPAEYAADVDRLNNVYGAGAKYQRYVRSKIQESLRPQQPVDWLTRKPIKGAKPVGPSLSTRMGAGLMSFLSENPITRASTYMTNKLDTAQRLTLMKFLESSPKYKNLTTQEIGQIINDTMLDYQHQSNLSRFAREWGAEFPHFHLTLVPRMVRAFFENPKQFAILSRSIVDFNQAFYGDTNRRFEPATPMNAPFKAVANPLKYGESVFGLYSALAKARTPEEVLSLILQGSIPAGGIIEEATNTEPYGKKIPQAERTGAAIMGGYMTSWPPPH